MPYVRETPVEDPSAKEMAKVLMDSLDRKQLEHIAENLAVWVWVHMEFLEQLGGLTAAEQLQSLGLQWEDS